MGDMLVALVFNMGRLSTFGLSGGLVPFLHGEVLRQYYCWTQFVFKNNNLVWSS